MYCTWKQRTTDVGGDALSLLQIQSKLDAFQPPLPPAPPFLSLPRRQATNIRFSQILCDCHASPGTLPHQRLNSRCLRQICMSYVYINKYINVNVCTNTPHIMSASVCQCLSMCALQYHHVVAIGYLFRCRLGDLWVEYLECVWCNGHLFHSNAYTRKILL